MGNRGTPGHAGIHPAREACLRVGLIVLGLVVPAVPASAQEDGVDPLVSLATPSTPAFAILGIEPTAIERPTTPRAFAASLLSATEQGTVLPDNYAVEIAPYWLTPKPDLTFRERYAPSLWQSIRQSFALSVATAKPGEDGADSTGTRLGVGVRLLVVSGRPSPTADAKIDTIRNLNERRTALRAQLEAERPLAGERRDSVRAVLDSLETVQQELGQEFIALQNDPPAGLRWEIAAAFAAEFPGDVFQDAELSDIGVWTTLAFRPTSRTLDVLVLGRLLWKETPLSAAELEETPDELVSEMQTVGDLGVRVIGAIDRLSLSAELLGRAAFDIEEEDSPAEGARRTVIEHESSLRVTGNIRYRLTDDLDLSWTFGKDFEPPGTDRDPLIALLGLQWRFGGGLELPLGATTR